MNKKALERLAAGEPILGHKEGGNSMTPIIKSRQPVDVYPVDPQDVELGDVVVARVKGRVYTHLVTGIASTGGKADKKLKFKISNNHGRNNGWTNADKVYGIVTHVDGAPLRNAFDRIKVVEKTEGESE